MVTLTVRVSEPLMLLMTCFVLKFKLLGKMSRMSLEFPHCREIHFYNKQSFCCITEYCFPLTVGPHLFGHPFDRHIPFTVITCNSIQFFMNSHVNSNMLVFLHEY